MTAADTDRPVTNADSKRQRMGEAVAEMQLGGDTKKVAAKYKISERTLFRWSARMGSDDKLTAIVSTKKAQVVEGWADELPGAIKAAISFIRHAAEEGDHKDPKMVQAMADSLEKLSDTAATWKVLDEKMRGPRSNAVPQQTGQVRPTGETARSGVPAGGSAGTGAGTVQH